MASQYEHLVELGIEGVDKLTDKYHDKVYGHLPAWKKQQQQHHHPHQRRYERQTKHHNDFVVEKGPSAYQEDGNMSSYSPQQVAPYAQDKRRDYRDDKDTRYVDERMQYTQLRFGGAVGQPNLAFCRMFEIFKLINRVRIDRFNQPQAPSGYDVGTRREYGRPVPFRQRSYSWSPPRSQRQYGESRRQRSRSRSREGSGRTMCKSRIAATIMGGIAGGFAGNRISKGHKYDTAATIGGAILGGVASREIADHFEKKRDERQKHENDDDGDDDDDDDDDGYGGGRRRGSRDYGNSRDSRDYGDSRDSRYYGDSRDSRGR